MSGIGRPTSLYKVGAWARLLAAFVGSNPTVYTNFLSTYLGIMNKVLFVLLTIFVVPVAAGPFTKFDATKNITNNTTITWEQVDDVQTACDKESKKRGLGGFKIQVEACSFWGKRLTLDVCHIITEKKTDLDTLGHEMRHCFQGAFHK